MQQPAPSDRLAPREPQARTQAPAASTPPVWTRLEAWPRWAAHGALGVLAALPLMVPWNGKYFDLDIYYDWANQLFAGQVPYRDFKFEYPPATLPLFALPRAFFAGRHGYVVSFMVLMWGFDLAQKRLLWQRCGERRWLALALHSVGGAMLYFTYLKRFDVALACLMFLGWDALWRTPIRWNSWGMWGMGVLLKLIPIFLAPLWAWQAWRRGGSWMRAAAGIAVGVATVIGGFGAAAAWAGPEAWSWLAYHQARGLQVGSSYMGLAILQHGLGHAFDWSFSFGAAHLAGPWSEHMARLSPAIMAAAVMATSLRLAPSMRVEAGHWRAATAVLLAVIFTSKVYSPQFTAWLVPFLVMAAVRSERLDWPLILGMLALLGLTAEVYPGEFAMLAGAKHKQAALVARALLMLTLWGYLLLTPRGLTAKRPSR